MKNLPSRPSSIVFMTALFMGATLAVPQARVLDDFDDNQLAAWTKFDFNTGAGQVVEENGQLRMAVPAVGDLFFVAATKTSEEFTIADGRTIEFRVDLVSANQDDAFAVLSFIPTTESVGTLTGYSVAKDVSDILITKGLNKYFLNEGADLKNENVTLSLSITGRGADVVLNARVLDKDNGNAVLFDRTFVDTPGADALDDGEDTPPGNFMGASGRFVLLLYHNDANGTLPGSQIVFDNAEVFVEDSIILDDFDDNQVTGWTKFDFNTNAGQVSEVDGQFKLNVPPVGDLFFVAATKTTQEFTITDGSTLEFMVDLVSANQDDAFAVLSFIPTSESVGTLTGYSMAKDVNDILITKGLDKYFLNEGADISNANVTLSLSLTGDGSDVVLRGRVFDKDNDNELLFDRMFTDTPSADSLEDGEDAPPGNYLGQSGRFVLLLYHNDTTGSLPGSQVIFDNARVRIFGQTADNSQPIISDLSPVNGANFVDASSEIAFTVQDDKPLSDADITLIINGQPVTAAEGLSITGEGNNRNVSFAGLEADTNYRVIIQVVDSDGANRVATLHFDTFTDAVLVVESEDYNLNGGQFYDENILIGELAPGQTGAYKDSVGAKEVDYSDTRTAMPTETENRYRLFDQVGTSRAADFPRQKFIDAGGAAADIYDYQIREIAPGEWLNYTRTFPEGIYEVYLRQSLFNLEHSVTLLEKVTSSRSAPDQETTPLGVFLGRRTGVEFRNVPLTDAFGNPLTVSLSGVETLRIAQRTTDPSGAYFHQNYLVLVPVDEAVGGDHPIVIETTPPAGATVNGFESAIEAVIVDRGATVVPGSIALSVNGQAGEVDVASVDGVTTVTSALTQIPAPGEPVMAELSFEDSEGEVHVNAWSFTLNYTLVPGSARIVGGTGVNSGFQVRVVQAPAGSNLANTLERAKEQLAPGSSIPAALDTNTVAAVMNYTQSALPWTDGFFEDTATFPGIDPAGNTDDIAMEAASHLQLSAGPHRFGVVSDDGFEFAVTAPGGEVLLGAQASGTFNGEFDFVVEEDGLYPVRLIWFERGGGAHVELFSFDSNGERVLINDRDNPEAILVFTTLEIGGGPLVLLSSTTVDGAYSEVTSAVFDAEAGTVTVQAEGGARFYQLSGDALIEILSITVDGGAVVMEFEAMGE